MGLDNGCLRRIGRVCFGACKQFVSLPTARTQTHRRPQSARAFSSASSQARLHVQPCLRGATLTTVDSTARPSSPRELRALHP
eukprot:scaffold7547_cov258-Pinguiococcus_pyrenoidosus.AAC.2